MARIRERALSDEEEWKVTLQRSDFSGIRD